MKACLVAALAAAAIGPVEADPATDAAFQRAFGERFFDRYWELTPDYAIVSGYYRYADSLRVPDAADRATRLAQLERWLATLQRTNPANLSSALRADWAILDSQFRGERWALTEQRAWQWDPSTYNVATGFAMLLDRDYAPLDERLRTFAKRLVNVPAYYAAAKTNVATPSREHTQLAIEQNRGALSVFGPELE